MGTRTRHRDQMRKIGDPFRLAPFHDAQHRIGAGDEVQLHIGRIVGPQLAERVDGIGVSLALHLERAHIEEGVARRCQVAHIQARLRIGDLLVQLEHGRARRHEHHRIQIECHPGLLGAGKMPDMDGIEGAAHDPQAEGALGLVETQPVEAMAYALGCRYAGRPVTGVLGRVLRRQGHQSNTTNSSRWMIGLSAMPASRRFRRIC